MEWLSDDEGRWLAHGLQPGYKYVAVGVDLTGVYKATAAGPVAPVSYDEAVGALDGD